MQQNLLHSLEGVEVLENLDTLNISSNQLGKLDTLSHCQNLRTLICTHNKLQTYKSVAELEQCPGLQTLDLQYNQLDDEKVC